MLRQAEGRAKAVRLVLCAVKRSCGSCGKALPSGWLRLLPRQQHTAQEPALGSLIA